MKVTYLDYSSNYPTKKEVLDELIDTETNFFANTNSLHVLGKLADKKYKECVKKTLNIFKLDSNQYEVVFLSSATEANNLVLQGLFRSHSGIGNRILTSEFEHSSINTTLSFLKDQSGDIDFIKTDKDGQLDLNDLKEKINSSTILICLCLVESELGTIQNYNKVLEILKDYPNCHLLLDATQGIGKFNFDFNYVDFITYAPHKFGGLIGTGVLLKKKNIILSPLIYGGKSESIYKPGTTPLSLISSSTKALELAYENMDKNYKYVEKLAIYLRNELSQFKDLKFNSFNKNPYITNISFDNVLGYKMVELLSNKNICVSQKSACSLPNTPSKIVFAIYKNKKRALESFRISISELTTKEDIDNLITALKEIIKDGKI